MPDPVMVEKACAFVVSSADAALTLDELVEFLEAKRIARQNSPSASNSSTRYPGPLAARSRSTSCATGPVCSLSELATMMTVLAEASCEGLERSGQRAYMCPSPRLHRSWITATTSAPRTPRTPGSASGSARAGRPVALPALQATGAPASAGMKSWAEPLQVFGVPFDRRGHAEFVHGRIDEVVRLVVRGLRQLDEAFRLSARLVA